MKKIYNAPQTIVVRVATIGLTLGSTQASGLDGIVSTEEYSGGSVNWSRRGSVWDDEDE